MKFMNRNELTSNRRCDVFIRKLGSICSVFIIIIKNGFTFSFVFKNKE